MSGKEKTSNAVEILHRRYVGEDAARKAALEETRTHAEVARTIYELRTAAGLSQQELADLIGTTQSAISRLEDEEYEGHSVSLLNRIASALNQRLTVVMEAKDPERNTLRYAFQTVLQDLRRSRGLTVDELSAKTGIDRQELLAAERNAGYRPTPLTLHTLSQFYGVEQQRLATLAGASPKIPRVVSESACRFAAQSEAFSKLTKEEQKALDQFVQVLKTRP